MSHALQNLNRYIYIMVKLEDLDYMICTLLHLHEIVEGLYFHFSLSVCLSVCVSVCPALLVNKIPAERMNRFGRGFR